MIIFICYDTNQKHYFDKNGFKSLIKGLHPKTLRPFWIYERNSEFDKCFKEWLIQKN